MELWNFKTYGAYTSMSLCLCGTAFEHRDILYGVLVYVSVLRLHKDEMWRQNLLSVQNSSDH